MRSLIADILIRRGTSVLAPMLSNLLGSMSEIRCSSQCASSISTSYCSSNSILLPECADAEAASVEKRESLACGMSSSSWSLEDLEQYIIEANLNVDDFGDPVDGKCLDVPQFEQ